MNILIVNAFGNSPAAKEKFSSFCGIIKSLFRKVSEKSGIDNFIFIYRTPKTISDFIYNHETAPGEVSQNDSTNKRNFDKIDIVFIDGGEKYIPWSEKGFRLSEFVRLCKVTGKIIYLGGVGFEILVYYLATGARNEFNFINEKGEIQAIEEIQDIPSNFLSNLKKNDNFLDFVTGDILEYRSVYHTWVPIMNIGLHKQITAEKYMQRGRFILPDGFKGKDYVKNQETLVSNCHEIKVDVLRQYLSHYLLNNLPVEFSAFTTLTWFPHYFNVSFKKYQFKVICQCDRGPVVIEHEQSVGVAFHPQHNYPETIKILENFIYKKFQEVQDKLFSFKKPEIRTEENELPLMFRNYKLNDEQRQGKKKLVDQLISYSQTNVGKVNNSRSFNRVKKVRDEAAHVGFGFNNRDMIFVENNAIIQNKILYNKKKIKEIITPAQQRQEILNEMFSIKRNEKARISAIFRPLFSNLQNHNLNQNEIMKNLKDGGNLDDDDNENGLEYITFIDRSKMDEKQLISFYKKARKRVCLKLDEIENTSNFVKNQNEKYKNPKNIKKFSKTQQKKYNLTDSEIFKKKYKNILKNKNKKSSIFLYDKDNDKEIQSQKKLNTMNMEAAYQSLINKKPLETNKTISYSKSLSSFLKRNKIDYKNLKLKNKIKDNKDNNEDDEDYYNTERNDATNRIKRLQEKWKEYDQLSPEQRQRREFLESKKKWVCKEDFHRHFGLHTTAMKPIPNVMSYGKPVTDYKFREVNHEKWLTPNGFL